MTDRKNEEVDEACSAEPETPATVGNLDCNAAGDSADSPASIHAESAVFSPILESAITDGDRFSDKLHAEARRMLG